MAFIPGDPGNVTDIAGQLAFNEAADALQNAESVIDETDAAIVIPMIETVKDAEALCIELEGICAGEIATTLNDAEALIAKIRDKITKSLDSTMSEAYAYMDLLGIPIPTEQDLSHAEATGDYLGTAGFGQTIGSVIPQIESAVYSGDASSVKTDQSQAAQPQQPQPPVASPLQIAPPLVIGGVFGGMGQGCETNGLTLGLGLYPGWNDLPLAVNNNVYQPVLYDEVVATGGGIPLNFSIYAICQPDSFCQFDTPPIPGNYLGDTAPVWVVAPFNWVPYWMPGSGDSQVLFAPTIPAQASCTLNYAVIGQSVATGGEISLPGTGPDTIHGGSCPIPDQLCGPDRAWKNLPGANDNEDVCKEIEEAIRLLSGETLKIGDFIGMASGAHQASTVGDAIINAITGGHEPILGGLMNRFAKWLESAVKAGANTVNCKSPAMLNASVRQAIINFVQKWTNALPEQLIRETQQISNTICQSRIPSGSEADAAYLADTITKEEWECWQKAEGNHLGPATHVLDAKRERITARQADQLYRQKRIDHEEMAKRMREHGVIRDEDRFAIRDLNIHWPSASDTVRFMQRDVFDQNIVDTAKLDEDFEKKYTGKAVDYADALGIDEQLMRYHWRSHWHLPSYTMGREFLYRFNDPELPDTIRFTEDDFRAMLKQDDWAPGYIERMIAASYHPINRTDAIKSYMIHVSDDETFIDQLVKTGYNKENATFMQGYYKKRREINDRKTSGYPTLRTAANAYARCEMAENEFVDIVRDISIDQDQTTAAYKAARLSRQIWERKQAIRTIKRPYVLGLYDDIQVQQELADAQVDPSCVDALITQWQRERMRADKFLSAEKLCSMREKGIISAEQQVIALVRSHWSEEDAVLIAEECAYRLSEKAANRARILAEKAAREMEKRRKAIEKANRLAECGPPPCPANRTQSNPPVAAGP